MAKGFTATKFKALPEVTYVYIGEGFIPGLPKAVTPAEAEHLGVFDVLQAAITNGSYIAQEQASGPADQEKE